MFLTEDQITPYPQQSLNFLCFQVGMSVSDQSRGWEQPLKATKDTDHFKDLPFATEKPLCSFPAANHQRISVIIYLVNNYDSVPVQTFLSIQQFSKEAGVELSEVIIAYINDSWEAELNSRVIETIRLFATIKVLSAEAETEWKAKLKAIRLTTAEQVGRQTSLIKALCFASASIYSNMHCFTFTGACSAFDLSLHVLTRH